MCADEPMENNSSLRSRNAPEDRWAVLGDVNEQTWHGSTRATSSTTSTADETHTNLTREQIIR